MRVLVKQMTLAPRTIANAASRAVLEIMSVDLQTIW